MHAIPLCRDCSERSTCETICIELRARLPKLPRDRRLIWTERDFSRFEGSWPEYPELTSRFRLLSLDQRTAIRYLRAGLTREEIARAMERTLPAVYMLIYRAKKILTQKPQR